MSFEMPRRTCALNPVPPENRGCYSVVRSLDWPRVNARFTLSGANQAGRRG